ncbi:MAG: Lysyl endopeptidase [Bacteroidetes bacterium]|nr:Lysyl endopeptidase [Bacteroidota bacterium]
MKKILLSALTLASALYFNTAVAQYSQGGTPLSFGKHFTATQAVPFVNMPSFDLASMQAEDAVNDQSKGPYRFGYNHMVNLSMTNSGAWTTLPNGDRLWQLGIKSKGAKSINLAMDDFFMPEGAKLFIYNEDRSMVIGAFTSVNNDASNHFATDLVYGESVTLEYYEPAAVAGKGHMNIFRVTHGYRGGDDYYKSFGQAGSCQVNVNCTLGANWQTEKKGIVCLVVGGSEFCSGSLVNDVPQDGKPYILTANHCSASNDMASWVFRFHWEAPTCANPSSTPTSQSLSGSVLRARTGTSDFCLVEITGGLSGGTVPSTYNPYFEGWSNVDVPATNAIGIHHPSGDIMKISEAANATSTSTMSGATCWRVGQWTTACTEPGSSGSALFDQNHHIVGQLFGGPSACGATAANMYDNYGKFAVSWLGDGTAATQLKPWLDPGNTGATIQDGFDPNAVAPAFTLDAAVSSVVAPATGYSSCNSAVTPQVILKNFGGATLTSCVINYKLDAGAVQTYNWTGTLNTNAATTVTLPGLSGLSVASHVFKAYTSSPNAGSEQNPPNDTASSTFSIISPSPVVTLPQTQGFESTFPTPTWTVGNPDADVTWATSTPGGFGTSTNSIFMDNYNTDITGKSDFIYSSYIDLTAAATPITLKFDVAYARYSATYNDSLRVNATTDCGTNWANLYRKGSTGLATAPDNGTSEFVPTAAQWRTETVSLNSYAGQIVKLSFENKSGYGQFLYIDNINISNTTTGVNENADLNSSVSVYPNPNNGQFNVSINMAKAKNVTIKVMNILGEVVSTKSLENVSNNVCNIDLTGQAKGMYFVEITADNEKVVKKINVIR